MPKRITLDIEETTTYSTDWDADVLYGRYFEHMPREEFDRLTGPEIVMSLRNHDSIDHEDFERYGNVVGQKWTATITEEN